jgi:uncharacterized protein YggE
MQRLMATLFVLAVFLTGSVVTAAAEDCCPRTRLISVSGISEVSSPPDEAILRLAVETRDKDLRIAKSQNDKNARKVIALAQKMGVDQKDIQTSELSMGAQYSEEKVPRMLGYEVSQTIAITLKDISKYDKLMTGLLEAGITRVHGVDFNVAEPRKFRDEARSKAIRAAKEKAAAMASELGQTIGKPWEISEQNEVGTLFTRANSYGMVAGVPESESSTVAPGQVTFKVSVRVSFQLE